MFLMQVFSPVTPSPESEDIDSLLVIIRTSGVLAWSLNLTLAVTPPHPMTLLYHQETLSSPGSPLPGLCSPAQQSSPLRMNTVGLGTSKSWTKSIFSINVSFRIFLITDVSFPSGCLTFIIKTVPCSFSSTNGEIAQVRSYKYTHPRWSNIIDLSSGQHVGHQFQPWVAWRKAYVHCGKYSPSTLYSY